MANALYHWVTESTKSHMLHGKTIEKHIGDLLKEQPLTTGSLLVYRGHDSDSRTIRATSWFSTSNDVKKVRRQHISKGADCCLFKIHILPGIHVIKVDEIIVEGGHTFYDSNDLISPGFKDTGLIEGVQVFETWYSSKGKSPKKSPKKSARKTVSKRRVLAIVDPEEYDLIDGIEDLKVSVPPSLEPGETVNNATYNEVWKSIKRRKGITSKGGSRKRSRKQYSKD